MELLGYQLYNKFFKEQKSRAKENAEKQFSYEPDDLLVSRRSLGTFLVDNEWTPRYPNYHAPSGQGNVSGTKKKKWALISAT